MSLTRAACRPAISLPVPPGRLARVANAGQSLPPIAARNIEVGRQGLARQIDYTAAIFRIQRPFANIDPTDNVFEISGEQVNKGLGVIRGRRNRQRPHGLRRRDLAQRPARGHRHRQHQRQDVRRRSQGQGQYAARVPHPRRCRAWWQCSTGNSPARAPGNDTNSFMVAGYNLFDLGARYTSKLCRARPSPGGWRWTMSTDKSLLVHHRAEQPHRRQYRKPDRRISGHPARCWHPRASTSERRGPRQLRQAAARRFLARHRCGGVRANRHPPPAAAGHAADHRRRGADRHHSGER